MAPTAEAVQRLREDELIVLGVLSCASNYTLLARVGDTEQGVHAVYKPQAGERPLWDFPRGSLARREVAAHLVDAFLDWGLVPPTVFREGPLGPGSVQLFIPHDPHRHYWVLLDDPRHRAALVRLATFDLLVNNADRKASHVMVPDDPADGALLGCDHGLCFHEDPKLRTVIWEFAGEPVSEELLEDLGRTAAGLRGGPLREDLLGLLSEREIDATAVRAERLVASGRFPDPGPQPGQYQWPPHQQWGQQWAHQPWHPAPRPRRDKGRAVLGGALAAASVALVALVASVAIVVNTPQQEAPTGGADVSAFYDSGLYARPNPAEIDIADHPLYDVAMPEPVDCPLPALRTGSDDSWETFANEAGGCLNELWAPVMDELGLVPDLPEITVTDEPLDTDTEDSFTLAYYESDRGLITLVLPNVRQVGEQIPDTHQEDVWLALMGHEYAHHVQYATGILSVSHDLRRTAGSEDDELDTLRRTELQAECMAGVGLRGLTDPEGDALDVVNLHFNDGGDLDTHGTAANRALWLEAGYSSPTVGGCNTYGADENEVT
jgi:uncharacterized repeat protein (TIGR03843 family)